MPFPFLCHDGSLKFIIIPFQIFNHLEMFFLFFFPFIFFDFINILILIHFQSHTKQQLLMNRILCCHCLLHCFAIIQNPLLQKRLEKGITIFRFFVLFKMNSLQFQLLLSKFTFNHNNFVMKLFQCKETDNLLRFTKRILYFIRFRC